MPLGAGASKRKVKGMQDSPWWDRGRHADRRPFLLARNAIISALRAWFEGEGFVAVEGAALQVSPGNETHLHAFRADWIGPDAGRSPRYLHTSPEFALKKLLAAGEDRIVDFARVFRNRERGALHAPEFTMVEWYRSGAPVTAIMEDCAAVAAVALAAAGRDRLALNFERAAELVATVSSGGAASPASTRASGRSPWPMPSASTPASTSSPCSRR